MISIHSSCKDRNPGRLDIMSTKCWMVLVRSLILNGTSMPKATRLIYDSWHKGLFYDYMCVVVAFNRRRKHVHKCVREELQEHSTLINGLMLDQIIAFGAIMCHIHIFGFKFWGGWDRIEVVDGGYQVCCWDHYFYPTLNWIVVVNSNLHENNVSSVRNGG